MTEPTRLLSSPESELERALLDAGRSYTASSSVRAKTLLALGLTAAGASSTASASAATSSLTKATLSKVAIGVLVLGGAAAPAWRYLGGHASSPPATHAAPVSTAPILPAQTPVTEPAPVVSAPVVSAPVVSAPVGAAEPVAPVRGPARTDLRPASAPPLTAELAALDAARASLSHNDPASALVALDGYSRSFPRGRLRIEAEVLRIGALAKSGQSDAARKRAELFLRLHPDSVLASRVRSYAGL